MPSPFPGMDPYLEEPGLWPDVHHRLISAASDLLTALVRPKYFVRIEERVFISEENDPGRSVIAPDLRIVPRPARATTAEPTGGTAPAGQVTATAVMEVGGAGTEAADDPIVATTLLEEEIHEPRIEVIDRERRAVVTVLEVVSPSNKVRGANARESYQRKRYEVMRSPSHWVEVDLLRAGEPLTSLEDVPPHDYLAHVSRVERRPRGLIWPIRLERRLPTIPIPLRDADPDAMLDLQAVLNTAYDRAGYDLQLDYTRDPVPPLSPPQSQWARARLASHGLRQP